MARLDLDYQSRLKPFPWAGLALLALALLASVLVAVYYRGVTEEIVNLESTTGKARAAGRQMTGSEREMKEMALEIKHANDVLGQITLPWDKLFQAVEWSSGKDIALLTIEPDAEKREVKITGEAKSIGALLNYVKQLAAQDIFSSVYLQRHQVQQRAPLKPVRFALVAEWSAAP